MHAFQIIYSLAMFFMRVLWHRITIWMRRCSICLL